MGSEQDNDTLHHLLPPPEAQLGLDPNSKSAESLRPPIAQDHQAQILRDSHPLNPTASEFRPSINFRLAALANLDQHRDLVQDITTMSHPHLYGTEEAGEPGLPHHANSELSPEEPSPSGPHCDSVSSEIPPTLDPKTPPVHPPSFNDEDEVTNLVHEPPPLGPDPYQFAPTKNSYWPTLDSSQWHQHRDYARLYNEVRDSGLPNHLKARVTVPSALNLSAWDSLLSSYHDTELCDFLRYGWPVGYTAPAPPPKVDKNHNTATDYPVQVRRFLAKENSLGALLGPFTRPPFTPWCHTAPILTTPKKDSTDRRVVLDLSYPKGSGVNGGITKNCLEGKARPYTLPSIQDLVTKVQLLGPHCYLWKADLARAYRQLRTDPFDVPLLTIHFEGQYWVDICPSFGARLSGAACQRTTTAVVYLLAKDNIWSLAYLDDFCGAAATLEEATAAYESFLNLADTLGLTLSTDKCQPPTQAMEWLGFHLNTNDMTLTVPKPKLRDILKECSDWILKKAATKKQVQSLAGKLNHISKCVRPARKFIGRILASIRVRP